MKKEGIIYEFNETKYKKYIKLIENKEFNKINKEITKFLRKILNETLILVEKNKIDKYVEDFEKIQLKMLDYSEKIQYRGNSFTNIKLKIPILKEKAEEEYLKGLKDGFNLMDIKENLKEMFSIIELTIMHIKELNEYYQLYLQQLEFLIEKLKELEKKIISIKKDINPNTEDYIHFEGLEKDLLILIGEFIKIRETLKVFIQRLNNLNDILKYANINYKKIFKQIIELRINLIKNKLKNNIAINKYKKLLGQIKKVNNEIKKKKVL